MAPTEVREGFEDTRGNGNGGRSPFLDACRQGISGGVEKSRKSVRTLHRAIDLRAFSSIAPAGFRLPLRRHLPDDSRIPAALASSPRSQRCTHRCRYPHSAGISLTTTFDRMPIHQFTQTGIVILDRQHFSIMPNLFRTHSSLSRRTRGFEVDSQGMCRLTRGHVRPIVYLRLAEADLGAALRERDARRRLKPRAAPHGEQLFAYPRVRSIHDEGSDACGSNR